MKVGDCVKVDYAGKWDLAPPYQWTGICTWTDGYMFEFLVDGEFETWDSYDLDLVGAEVVNEGR